MLPIFLGLALGIFSFLPAQTPLRAVIHSIEFDSTFTRLDQGDLADAAGLKSGQPFFPDMLKPVSRKLFDYLYEQGYLYARIDSVYRRFNSDSSQVDLKVKGNPGKQVGFGEVKIKSDSIATQEYEKQLSWHGNEPFSQSILEKDINNMLAFAADSGFVFARVNVNKVDITQKDGQPVANVLLYIREGERVRIDKIRISGNVYTRNSVILRELPVQQGDYYSKNLVSTIPERLLRLGIFDDVKEPEMRLDDKGNYILNLIVKEGNATSFDGVVGYIPENQIVAGKTKSGGYFSGLVDISFHNLFGTGRSFDVHWEKPDRISENFSTLYTEPWFLNYPLDLSAGLERTVRDSTYLEWKGQFKAKFHYSHSLSFLGGVDRVTVLPDSFASRDLRLVRYAQTNLELGLEYDTRDYPVNPRKGIYYSSSYVFGFKNNFGPSYLFREDSIEIKERIEILKLNFRIYYELFRNQVLAFKITGNQVKGNRLQLTDFTWFGGARTLRGYRENQFRGDITAWSNVEYRFIMARKSRVFVFNDWGVYRLPLKGKKIQKILMGYGIGIRLNTGLGVLGIDFGLGKGDSFSQGKIHFGIINKF